VALTEIHCPEFGLADACRILQYRLEHRLQLARRRADDAQHLRCGFLSLQRFVALTGELSNVGLCSVVGRGRLAQAATFLRFGLAAARFGLFGACSGAPSHCLASAQQSVSYRSGPYCASQQNLAANDRSGSMVLKKSLVIIGES